MLHELERRLVAIVADAVTPRTHLTVSGGAVPATALAGGRGRVAVRVAELAAKTTFMSETIRETRVPPVSRRVLGLDATIRVLFQVRAATTSAADLDAARTLLLEDVSIVGHALADRGVTSGDAFLTPEDTGFRVHSFLLARGTGMLDAGIDPLSSELQYACDAEIWPPEAVSGESVMTGVSTVVTTTPVEGMRERVVAAGRTLAIDLRSLALERPGAAGQPASPLRLALRVLSTAPPAARGTITSGVAGAEPGIMVLPVSRPDTSIVYQAPAQPNGARTEYVAVHYATPDSRAGIFLGAVAVRIRGTA
jgi:hypothetical protein